MTRLSSVLSVAALLALSAGASAAPKAAPKVSAKAAALVCPVTGDKIASVKAAAGSSTYQGKTYYFCCNGCKPLFDKNPAKYAKPAAKPAAK